MGGTLPEPKKCPVIVQNVKEIVRPADGVENGKFASPAAQQNCRIWRVVTPRIPPPLA